MPCSLVCSAITSKNLHGVQFLGTSESSANGIIVSYFNFISAFFPAICIPKRLLSPFSASRVRRFRRSAINSLIIAILFFKEFFRVSICPKLL